MCMSRVSQVGQLSNRNSAKRARLAKAGLRDFVTDAVMIDQTCCDCYD